MSAPKSISTLLNESTSSQKSVLQSLLSQSKHLEAWTQELYKVLDPKMAKHCQVAGFEEGLLSLIVDHINWKTRIRFAVPDLIEQLQKLDVFKALKKIDCKVALNLEETIKTHSTSKDKLLTDYALSKEAQKLLSSTAKRIKDPQLKKALLRWCKDLKK